MVQSEVDLTCPRQKRDYNQQVFTRISTQYDRMTRLLSFGRDRHWKNELVSLLPQRAKPFVVDFASGTGDLTALIAERYPDSRILGLDLTESMVRLARLRVNGNGTRWSVGDMIHSPLGNGCVDLIAGGYALRNAPSLDAFLREIRRVLRPGGTAAFLDFSRPACASASVLQYLCLWLWGGCWGLLACRKPSVYQYIAKSLRLFPNHRDLEKLLFANGFEAIQTRRLFFGMSAIVTFRKPEATGPGMAER